MGDRNPDAEGGWLDPDDAPEWTDEMLDTVEFRTGGKLIRAATGYLGPNGVVRGVPSGRGRDKPQA
ncbi:hypothetical protein [Sphingomonas bacterium]|uniref:hypothetical protein n=1 Tax=Sphingomonas bacterium TaxID=1895847 RepID=UPI001575791E|nr:hypothetical protein [Sphingomonas bacterium]